MPGTHATVLLLSTDVPLSSMVVHRTEGEMRLSAVWYELVLPRLGSELARRAEAGCFVTRLTGPILGKVAVPMTVDST